jgi:acetoin utilization deacetylase AcuC-like enzyme
MRVVYSPAHLAHDVRTQTILGVQVPANEIAERAETIRTTLIADGGFELLEPVAHGEAPITAVHDPGLLRFLQQAWDEAERQGHPYGFLAPETIANAAVTEGMRRGVAREASKIDGRAGFWALDTSTYILPGTYAAARAAVDVALTAADHVLAGDDAAYGLCRPPGHHAARSMYGGFCYFNNAAIAAEAIARRTGEHVSILDVDFHHGNGTEQIFWRRGDVLYVSLHGDPRGIYPYYSGYATERGAADGLGTTLNLPLAPGTDGDAYLAALAEGLDAIRDFDADAPLVVSLGFDTYHADPICNLALQTDDYRRIGEAIADLAMPVVALQEGGYAVDALGANAVAFLGGIRARPGD